MAKTMARKTVDRLLMTYRRYKRTGDKSDLQDAFGQAEQLSKSAFKINIYWVDIFNIAAACINMNERLTNDDICKIMKSIGLRIEEE